MSSNRQEVIFHDSSEHVPTVFGFFIIGAALSVWLGFRTDGAAAICLFVVAGLLLTYVVYVTQSLLRVGPSRMTLTAEGLVYKVGRRHDLVPREAIEAVGLVRRKGAPDELALWYDRSHFPELPKNFRHSERAPGQIRLAHVMDERNFFPPERVREVRELVQSHGLGEWRHRQDSV